MLLSKGFQQPTNARVIPSDDVGNSVVPAFLHSSAPLFVLVPRPRTFHLSEGSPGITSAQSNRKRTPDRGSCPGARQGQLETSRLLDGGPTRRPGQIGSELSCALRSRFHTAPGVLGKQLVCRIRRLFSDGWRNPSLDPSQSR